MSQGNDNSRAARPGVSLQKPFAVSGVDASARLYSQQSGSSHPKAKTHSRPLQQGDGLEGLEQIYASAHVGLAVLDADLRFSRVNQWLAQMHGIPIAAHIGRGLREICPDRAEQSEALLYRVIRTGEPALECEVRCGKHLFVEHYVPLRDRAGAVVGINIAVEDVTRLKQIETELRAPLKIHALAV